MMRMPAFRFRYSLRLLMLFVTLSAVFFAWFGHRLRQARIERQVRKDLQIEDNCFLFSHQSSHYAYVEGGGDEEPVGPPWLRKIVGDEFFNPVRTVVIRFVFDDNPDHYLDNLRLLSQLECLEIETGNVTAEHARKIAKLTALRRLTLAGCCVPPDLLHLLAPLHLEELNLTSCEVSAMDFTPLLSNTQITSLDLSSTNVTDDQVGIVVRTPNLQSLYISACGYLTRTSLNHLSHVATLRWLDVSHCAGMSIRSGGTSYANRHWRNIEDLRPLFGLRDLDVVCSMKADLSTGHAPKPKSAFGCHTPP